LDSVFLLAVQLILLELLALRREFVQVAAAVLGGGAAGESRWPDFISRLRTSSSDEQSAVSENGNLTTSVDDFRQVRCAVLGCCCGSGIGRKISRPLSSADKKVWPGRRLLAEDSLAGYCPGAAAAAQIRVFLSPISPNFSSL
jgi:hypothetical protein